MATNSLHYPESDPGGNPTNIVHLLLLFIFVLPEVMSGR